MTHKPQVGIMQGRLSNQIGDSIQSFPGVYWKEEFDQASNLGFNTIEWIFDSHKNPLFHSDAISEIISIKKKCGVVLQYFRMSSFKFSSIKVAFRPENRHDFKF